MSSDQSPYKMLNDAVRELLRQYNNGHYTASDRQLLDSRIKAFRTTLLTIRLDLPEPEADRYEPERSSLLHTLQVIQNFLPFPSDSPYAALQADVKALFIRAGDQEERQHNRDSILNEIRRLRCDSLSKMHTLSKDDQDKHEQERRDLHRCLTQIERSVQ
jgi:hypothetical protein